MPLDTVKIVLGVNGKVIITFKVTSRAFRAQRACRGRRNDLVDIAYSAQDRVTQVPFQVHISLCVCSPFIYHFVCAPPPDSDGTFSLAGFGWRC